MTVVHPTRCNVLQYSLLLSILYMFRAVSPPIIMSSKTVHTASGTCQACLLPPLAVEASKPDKVFGITRLISQSLQLKAQVTLASLGCCHKSGKQATSCARISLCFSVRAVEMPIFICLRSIRNHVTEVGR
jgi:hypothetical protein